jgi:peroxiredoxin
MKNPVSVALAFALIAGMTAPVTHSRADAQMQDASPGIALGAKAPTTLALQTSAGKPTSLAKEMGPNGILVVMVRSADWCPFCKAQLSGLNSIRPKLAEMGYALVSLSYDKPDKLAGFARTKGITFPMLSDQGSKLIDAMALRDPQYAAVPFANGVPYATVLVIGKDGRVKAKNVSKDYKVRPTNAQILAMIPRMKG